MGIDGLRLPWRESTSGPRAYGSLLLTSKFGIDWLEDGARVYVLLSGDVDISTAPGIARRLRRAERMGLEVVVDLEDTTFMDCAGVRALLQASADMGPDRFSVTPGPPQVQRLFELVGIANLLRVASPPLARGRTAA